jgi:hypothetical protein
VPCSSGIEQAYYTLSVSTKFYGVFVSDLQKRMKLISGVLYQQDNMTQDIDILKPFNQIYPTIIQNARTKFRSLSVSGNILDSDDRFNAEEIREIMQEWIAFLTDGKPKFIKDWNGDILMGMVTTPPSFTYKNNGGMVIPQLSFTLTEQGKYDNTEDLQANGFLEE